MALDIHDLKAGNIAGQINLESLLSANASTSREVIITTSGTPTSEIWHIMRPLTGQEFMEQQYREGKLLNLPTQQPLTQEEQAERDRLAQLFAGGKSMSEIVIEGRGPH